MIPETQKSPPAGSDPKPGGSSSSVSSSAPPWLGRVLAWLFVLIALLVLVSLGITTWHQIFPRPAPAPTYVCVYVTPQGTVSTTGSAVCPPPTGPSLPARSWS